MSRSTIPGVILGIKRRISGPNEVHCNTQKEASPRQYALPIPASDALPDECQECIAALHADLIDGKAKVNGGDHDTDRFAL
jgi:hypothetical protein